MKLLTLNTHSWLEDKDEAQINELAHLIQESNCDLVALQEVNQGLTSPLADTDAYFTPIADQTPIQIDNFAYRLTQRLQALGCAYYWSWAYNHIGYDRFQEGVALLSKEPLTTSAHLLSETTDPADYHTRYGLLAQTTVAGTNILAASLHLSWWEGTTSSFAYEWQRLEKALADSQLPIALLGDFNNPAHITAGGYDLVMQSPLQLQDSYQIARERQGSFTIPAKIAGWEEATEPMRIDYVFVRNLPITHYQIVFDDHHSPKISDHFGILVTGEE